MHTKKRKSICLLLATCPLFGLIGCSGLELGGKLGVYRVDTYSQQSHTYRKPMPWKCFFTTCEEAEKQPEGS